MAKTMYNVYVTTLGTGQNISSFTTAAAAMAFARSESRKPETLSVTCWRGKAVKIKPAHPRLLLNL
jgi:hypothetical protein